MQGDSTMVSVVVATPIEDMKALGKFALRERWQIAIMCTVVIMACVQVPFAFFKLQTLFNTQIASLDVSLLVGSFLVLTILGPFALGMAVVFLDLFRGGTVKISDGFLGFKEFGKALRLMLLYSLYVFFGALLLVVPGVIVAMKYSQAFFILADDPRKGIMQCMDESKVMMEGNIFKYFFLIISFIGWVLVAFIPHVIILLLSAYSQSGEMMTEILSIVVGIVAFAPLFTYVYSTLTSFYEIVSGNLSLEPELGFEI